MPNELALKDFLKRIEHYQDKYEPLDETKESSLSFMKIYNTGRYWKDSLREYINRAFGYFEMGNLILLKIKLANKFFSMAGIANLFF